MWLPRYIYKGAASAGHIHTPAADMKAFVSTLLCLLLFLLLCNLLVLVLLLLSLFAVARTQAVSTVPPAYLPACLLCLPACLRDPLVLPYISPFTPPLLFFLSLLLLLLLRGSLPAFPAHLLAFPWFLAHAYITSRPALPARPASSAPLTLSAFPLAFILGSLRFIYFFLASVGLPVCLASSVPFFARFYLFFIFLFFAFLSPFHLLLGFFIS